MLDILAQNCYFDVLKLTHGNLGNLVWVAANRFLHALAADGAINEENLSQSELDRTYGPLRAQVLDSVTRQQDILANVEVSMFRKCQRISRLDGVLVLI